LSSAQSHKRQHVVSTLYSKLHSLIASSNTVPGPHIFIVAPPNSHSQYLIQSGCANTDPSGSNAQLGLAPKSGGHGPLVVDVVGPVGAAVDVGVVVDAVVVEEWVVLEGVVAEVVVSDGVVAEGVVAEGVVSDGVVEEDVVVGLYGAQAS